MASRAVVGRFGCVTFEPVDTSISDGSRGGDTGLVNLQSTQLLSAFRQGQVDSLAVVRLAHGAERRAGKSWNEDVDGRGAMTYLGSSPGNRLRYRQQLWRRTVMGIRLSLNQSVLGASKGLLDPCKQCEAVTAQFE